MLRILEGKLAEEECGWSAATIKERAEAAGLRRLIEKRIKQIKLLREAASQQMVPSSAPSPADHAPKMKTRWNELCAWCGHQQATRSLQLCGKCGLVRCCDAACQKVAWKVDHKRS